MAYILVKENGNEEFNQIENQDETLLFFDLPWSYFKKLYIYMVSNARVIKGNSEVSPPYSVHWNQPVFAVPYVNFMRCSTPEPANMFTFSPTVSSSSSSLKQNKRKTNGSTWGTLFNTLLSFSLNNLLWFTLAFYSFSWSSVKAVKVTNISLGMLTVAIMPARRPKAKHDSKESLLYEIGWVSNIAGGDSRRKGCIVTWLKVYSY